MTNNKYLNNPHLFNCRCQCKVLQCLCVYSSSTAVRGVQRTGVDTSEDGDYSAGPTAPPPVDGDTDILME